MHFEKNLTLDLYKIYEKKQSNTLDLEPIVFEEYFSPAIKTNIGHIYKKNYLLMDNILNDSNNDKIINFEQNKNLKKIKFDSNENTLKNNLTDIFLGNNFDLENNKMENIEKKLIFFLINKKMKRNLLFFKKTEFNYLNLLNSIGRFKTFDFRNNFHDILKYIFVTFLKSIKKKKQLSIKKIFINFFGKNSKIEKNSIFIGEDKFETLNLNFLKKIQTFELFRNQFLKYLKNFGEKYKEILKKKLNEIIMKIEKIGSKNFEKTHDDLYFYKIFTNYEIKIPYHLKQINSFLEKLIKTF